MFTSDRTRRVAQTKFTTHEVTINKGEALALDGWWDAGVECRSLGVSASEYAITAAKESARKNKGGKHKPYSENTIRQSVGYVLRALEQGSKKSEFDGWIDLRKTMTGSSTKKGKAPKPVESGTRKVTATTRKAYDALFATAEFRALPAAEKALLRKLAKGQSFHTNIG